MSSHNEQRRLDELRRYEILDTIPWNSFERLTRLASNIFSVPVALISLVDEIGQWFNLHQGSTASETSISAPFCKYTIQGEGVFVVPDAAMDDRFAGDSLVVQDTGIRFYAGTPLRTPRGIQVGTLCIIDPIPRVDFHSTQQQILTDLAALVIDEMELRLALRKATREQSVRSEAITATVAGGTNGILAVAGATS